MAALLQCSDTQFYKLSSYALPSGGHHCQPLQPWGQGCCCKLQMGSHVLYKCRYIQLLENVTVSIVEGPCELGQDCQGCFCGFYRWRNLCLCRWGGGGGERGLSPSAGRGGEHPGGLQGGRDRRRKRWPILFPSFKYQIVSFQIGVVGSRFLSPDPTLSCIIINVGRWNFKTMPVSDPPDPDPLVYCACVWLEPLALAGGWSLSYCAMRMRRLKLLVLAGGKSLLH